MSYVTQSQLIERYGEIMIRQLSDRAVPASGVIDTPTVDRALADTDALIDGYLAGRYALPLAATPALLIDLAGAIAIYKLHRAMVPDKVRADHDDALKRLSDIATGKIRLNVAGIEPDASAASSGVRTNLPERPMSAEGLKGYI